MTPPGVRRLIAAAAFLAFDRWIARTPVSAMLVEGAVIMENGKLHVPMHLIERFLSGEFPLGPADAEAVELARVEFQTAEEWTTVEYDLPPRKPEEAMS